MMDCFTRALLLKYLVALHVLLHEETGAKHLAALLTGERLHFLMYHSYVHL